MSLQYAETKIREALALANGNKTKAQHIVNIMAQKDVKLLYALTKNHMSGIVAFHIDRVLSGKSAVAPSSSSNVRAAPVAKPRTSVKTNQFGVDVLKASTGPNAEVFGFDSGAPTGRRAQASKNHVDAIKLIAARGRAKL